ncbi:subtilisin-like protein [Lentinus brumalis]|uniref:Subtilisin-like protein n=1 Tax=Lentinus brumalis TaxID=2498619 RepID=A0A371DXE9_9APHY|nr:subtilisin-like protein [Polyporus brumalis]
MVAFPKLILCLATLAVSVASTSLRTSPRVTRGFRRSVARGWSLHRRADPDTVLPLKFTLVQSNLENLDSYLLDIADPHSPNYGNHWSYAKVAETFRPSKESVDTVHSWLVDDLGIDSHKVQINGNGDTVQLNITVAEAENILGAEYYIYRAGEGEDERIGCHEGYSLPEHVSKHVDFVWPTIHLGRPSLSRRDGFVSSTPGAGQASPGPRIKKAKSKLPLLGCDEAVTLDCLRDLYNFHYTPVSRKKNSVAVAEFEEEIFQQSDLNLFFQTYEPSLVDFEPKVVSIENGTVVPPGDFGEATLDIELVMGLLGPKQNVTVFQVGEVEQPIDALLAAFDASYCDINPVNEQGLTDCGNKPRANVVSISYHFEPDYIDPGITPIVQRGCREFGKLSLTGITWVASSGDGGVAYSQAEECLVDGELEFFPDEGSFVGQFPASCPYVTAVGATSVAPGKSAKDPEIATTAFPSGGGFSNNFPLPKWQEAVVRNYVENFANKSYGPDIYNRSGRAYPDVSTNGFPTLIAEGGGFVLTGGTSASAPIFASFVAAINDARLARGKKPVGWINPALYSFSSHVYNDVTNGTNPGCGTDGFSAAPGWDPITGLGTPNFPKLLQAFLELR